MNRNEKTDDTSDIKIVASVPRGEVTSDNLRAIQVIDLSVTTTHFLQAFATDQPAFSAPTRPPLIVQPGHGFYWASTAAPRWTDNKDNGSNRWLDGWDFHPEEQVVTFGRRAQLIGLATLWGGQKSAFLYDKDLDSGFNGTKMYFNSTSAAWTIYWYMNDRLDGYRDNEGVANLTFAIERA